MQPPLSITHTYYRKKANDQESIQLPNTFQFKTPKGMKDALKVMAQRSNHFKETAKRTVSSKTWPNGYEKKKKKELTGGGTGGGGGEGVRVGLNRFYVATTLTLSSAVGYTQDICSVRNISDNIKIKRIKS